MAIDVKTILEILRKVGMEVRSEAAMGLAKILMEIGNDFTMDKIDISMLPGYKTGIDSSIFLGFASKFGLLDSTNKAVVIVELGKDGAVLKNDLAKSCDDRIYSLLSSNNGIVIIDE